MTTGPDPGPPTPPAGSPSPPPETPPPTAEPATPPDAAARARPTQLTDQIVLSALSVVAALVVGALLIVAADDRVRTAAGYFFARPLDTLQAAGSAVGDAYRSLLQGALVDTTASGGAAFRPLTESLVFATPLIAAGLAVALAFRAGLFNIGAEGQVILGAAAAGWVGFAWSLPPGIHLLVATAVGMLAGAAWGWTSGILKAKTGAHEVITTIMLNHIGAYLLAFLLTLDAFQRAESNQPISPPVLDSAAMPPLLGDATRLHLGVLFALLAAAGVWWLLGHSTIGFRMRAVGAGPDAARTAGIDVARTTALSMALAGSLAGLAGACQVLGTEKSLTSDVSGGVGYDAITVALLGRGSPLGTVLAGLLFGMLKAGGMTMQARTGTPIDLVLVLQSLIVLFIAAPPLIRSIFRVRSRAGTGLRVSSGWGS